MVVVQGLVKGHAPFNIQRHLHSIKPRESKEIKSQQITIECQEEIAIATLIGWVGKGRNNREF